jgi:hypothetical protein
VSEWCESRGSRKRNSFRVKVIKNEEIEKTEQKVFVGVADGIELSSRI